MCVGSQPETVFVLSWNTFTIKALQGSGGDYVIWAARGLLLWNWWSAEFLFFNRLWTGEQIKLTRQTGFRCADAQTLNQQMSFWWLLEIKALSFFFRLILNNDLVCPEQHRLILKLDSHPEWNTDGNMNKLNKKRCFVLLSPQFSIDHIQLETEGTNWQ